MKNKIRVICDWRLSGYRPIIGGASLQCTVTVAGDDVSDLTPEEKENLTEIILDLDDMPSYRPLEVAGINRSRRANAYRHRIGSRDYNLGFAETE